MNINKIIIGGRLTDDPEIRMTTGDIPVCKFTVAVNRGGKEPKADFINCVAFRRTAEFVGKWFKKGRSIVVMGSMRSSSVERDGKKIVCWSLVVDEVDFGGEKNEDTREERKDTDERYFGGERKEEKRESNWGEKQESNWEEKREASREEKRESNWGETREASREEKRESPVESYFDDLGERLPF